MKLLHVDSSILGDNSASRAVSAAIVEKLKGAHPGAEIVYRDLAAAPLAHLSGAHLAAGAGAPVAAELQADVAEGGKALEEFLAADTVVIGAPMYNFAISSQLKAWIDRLAIVGKTFRYTENGPEGLAGGKRVLVAIARGGQYADGGPAAAMDFQEPYLKAMFGFFGITDVEFVRAEGLAIGPEQREAGLKAAMTTAAGIEAQKLAA